MGIDNLDEQGRKMDGRLPSGNNCHAGSPGSRSKAGAYTREKINRKEAQKAQRGQSRNRPDKPRLLPTLVWTSLLHHARRSGQPTCKEFPDRTQKQ